jgi:hypothetical protein
MDRFSAERVFGASDVRGLVIEEAQIVLHEADEPDLVADFLDANVPTGEGRSEINLASADARVPALSHRDSAIMEGIFEVTEAARGRACYIGDNRRKLGNAVWDSVKMVH